MVPGKSAHPRGGGGREHRPQGDGGDRETQPGQAPWSAHAGAAPHAHRPAGQREPGDAGQGAPVAPALWEAPGTMPLEWLAAPQAGGGAWCGSGDRRRRGAAPPPARQSPQGAGQERGKTGQSGCDGEGDRRGTAPAVRVVAQGSQRRAWREQEHGCWARSLQKPAWHAARARAHRGGPQRPSQRGGTPGKVGETARGEQPIWRAAATPWSTQGGAGWWSNGSMTHPGGGS